MDFREGMTCLRDVDEAHPPLSAAADKLLGQPMFGLLSRAGALAQSGRRIIHFEIGDPDFDSPPAAIDAAIGALRQGQTHYTVSRGLLAFREEIVEYTRNHWGFAPDLAQIIVCPANAAIDFVLRCVADPGDEIIVPDPGFPTYAAVMSYQNLVPVPVELKRDADFRMRPEDVRTRITDRTRAIIVNSPHNPTGGQLTREDAEGIAQLAEEYNLHLLSDEVYSRLIYEGTHYSPVLRDRCARRSILLNSLSKTFAMSGWRLGYCVAPVPLAEKMNLLVQTILSCIPPFTQIGGMAALGVDESHVDVMRQTYHRRAQYMVDGLNKLDGIECQMPVGSFYLFPKIDSSVMPVAEYADRLLEEKGICVLPGEFFGAAGKDHVRLSMSAVSERELADALASIGAFHRQYFSNKNVVELAV